MKFDHEIGKRSKNTLRTNRLEIGSIFRIPEFLISIASVVLLLGWLAGACLFGCASAAEVKVESDHTFKKRFEPSISLSRIKSIPAQSKVFTNEPEWNPFWQKVGISPPKVDFETDAVFAVFGGQKPSSGYAVEIKQIFFHPEKKSLRIEVLETEPAPFVGTLTVLTFPYDVVTFKRPGEWKNIEITRRKQKGK